MSYSELLRLVAPETALVVTALVVLGWSVARKSAADMAAVFATVGLVIAGVTTTLLPARATLFDGMIVVTPLTTLFKLICLLLAAFAVLLASRETTLPHRGEYIAIIVLATIGLMLLVGSEELLVIFIGLELLGLSAYVLTAFDKLELRSAEAGLKYLLFGSTASAFTLFGISLVYGASGSTSLPRIAQSLTSNPVSPLLAAGIVMTLVGFAFKVAAAPFHLWAPDTYQGAPVSSAAFIASASKVASFFILGKIVLVGFAPLHGAAGWHGMLAGWSPLLAVMAALSILIGNFVALVQTNVRRLLAYSAVAHSGYTLIGFVAAGPSGFSAALFYTTVYAFTLVGAFAVCAVVRQQTGGDDLDDFTSLAARSPLAAGAMTVFLLSLAGLPPLAGFFGKFYLFVSAFRPNNASNLIWLVALALFGSLVSLYYYLTILRTIFLRRAGDAMPPVSSVGAVQNSLLAVVAVIVLVLGIMPAVLLSRILAAVG
jgi:NADH-quinone oxidoreductase subunit N